MSDMYEATHKLVATWIPTKDFELLQKLAQANNVKLAAYIRAIIVDALHDESCIVQTTTSSTTHQQVV